MKATLRYARDRLVASDPARGQLRTAAWALLTAGGSTACLLGLARLFDLPHPIALAGVVVALVSTVSLQEPTVAAQQRTLAAVAAVSGLVMVLGAALADSFVASGAAFLAVTMAGFWAQRFGARAAAVGRMGYQSYFYALLLQPPVAYWPWLLAGVALACAIAWLVRFRLLPERPPALLRHELDALRACILALLHDLARSLAAPQAAGPARRARAGVQRLNDLSLRLEQRLARFTHDAKHDDGEQAPLRDRVLRAEIAAETLQACSAAARADAHVTPGARAALAESLRAVAQAVRAGDAEGAPRPAGEDALDADQRWRFDRSVHALLDDPPWQGALPPVADSTTPAGGPAQPAPAPHASPWRWLEDEPTRRAVQAGAAALVAMLAGHALSQEHWYWGVFGALVVFTQAGTRGQALAGAWRRLLGSVAGLALGLLVAELAHGHPAAQLVLLFAFVAIGFYAFQAYQAAYIALLTAMLAMLYELVGKYSPGLLVLRLEETALGAAAAILSAFFVLPAHTGEQSDQESVELLREAARLLRVAVADDDPRPADAVRELDRRMQALRQALEPVTGASSPTAKHGHRRRLHHGAVLVYCLRHFDNLLAGYAGEHRERLGAPARQLAQQLEGVADGLSGQPMPEVAELQDAPEGERPGTGEEADTLRIARHWLVEANRAVRALAEESAPQRS